MGVGRVTAGQGLGFAGILGLMEALIEGIKIVFFGLLMFSLIIVVHEAGHFTTARLFGLRVKEFMLGLPGPNIGFTFKGTKFGVTPILLGGYAQIAGEAGGKPNTHLASAFGYLASRGSLRLEELEEASATLGYDLEEALDVLDAWGTVKRLKKKGRCRYVLPATSEFDEGQPRPVSQAEAAAHIEAERKLTFSAAPWYQRVIILAAGALFNLLFAIIVITAVLMATGSQVPTTTVDTVLADSPAAAAGLVPGDVIIALDGGPITSWEEFTTLMAERSPGEEATVTVRDATGTATRDATVTLAESEGRAIFGITCATTKVPIPFTEALQSSVGFIGMVANAILQLFNPATFSNVVSQSASVIGVSFEARAAAEAGFAPFIFLTAALSISIGLMNLLPFPPLDGGKIVLETIERVTRRSIPVRAVNTVSIMALALLIMLFFFVTGQDVQRYIIGS